MAVAALLCVGTTLVRTSFCSLCYDTILEWHAFYVHDSIRALAVPARRYDAGMWIMASTGGALQGGSARVRIQGRHLHKGEWPVRKKDSVQLQEAVS